MDYIPTNVYRIQHGFKKLEQQVHPLLVKLYSYFEDSNFVYIVLEICRKRFVNVL